MPTVSADKLIEIAESLLTAAGASHEEAAIVARYNIGANLAGEPQSSQTRRQHRALRRTPRNHGLTVAPQHLAATRRPWTGYEATSENTGGSRVATVDQLAPASPEPNTSPEVAPK